MIFAQGNLGSFWYFDVPKGLGERNSRLPGLCQNGVFSSLTLYSFDGALKWTPDYIWSPKQIDLSLKTLPDIPRCPLIS